MIPTDEQVPDGSTSFSREDAADVTVGIGYEIDGLKLNDNTVSTDYYSLSDDETEITIDKDYLAAMSNGTKEFAIILDDNNTTPTTVLWDVVISGAHEDEFDRSDPDDVAMSVSDAEITGLKYQDAAVDASAYAISNSNHTITIKKEYLATLSNGDKTFKVLEGTTAYDEVTITISGNHTATFTRSAAADVTVGIADVDITGLKYGDAAVDSSNYTIASGARSITIKKEYIANYSNGDQTFKIMEGTAYDTVVVTISGNGSASFSKAAAEDITVTLLDVTINGLKNGSATVNTDNYTIAEDAHSITIDKTYLSGLTNGDKTFHVLYGEDGDFSYAVTVGD